MLLFQRVKVNVFFLSFFCYYCFGPDSFMVYYLGIFKGLGPRMNIIVKE